MSRSATFLGLAAVAAAAVPAYGGSSAAPAYGSSAPAYDPSSSQAWPASSAAPSYPASSEPAVYGSSSWGYSASSSVYVSAVPSSSYSAYPSASASAVIPSQPPYPACWTECFQEAGVTSESDLCGNVEVDQCIHDGCCAAESYAYWQWYDSYCPAASSSYVVSVVPSSTVPVGPYSSSFVSSVSSVPSASATPDCWSQCFAENDVTSEASLCGNDAVSACIHDTCCAALDKAYWVWYTGYCVAETTTVVTVTTEYTPTATPDGPVTTTFEYTSCGGYTPASSPVSPVTTLPAPPASPVAPYTTYPAAGGSSAGAYGASPTGAWGTPSAGAPSASAWAPAPATGSGAMTKPGFVFGAVMAVLALF